jgi:hypothetical protein
MSTGAIVRRRNVRHSRSGKVQLSAECVSAPFLRECFDLLQTPVCRRFIHPRSPELDYARHRERIVQRVVVQQDFQIFQTSVIVWENVAFTTAVAAGKELIQVSNPLGPDCPVLPFNPALE